jgi:hypothetical protein
MSIVRVLVTGALLLVVATAAACYNDNPYYCEDRAYHNCANAPGTFPCNEKSDCAAQDGKLSCSELNEATGYGICVQCTASDAAACLGVTPVCGADHLCKGCGKHTDCSSAACLSDGSCASETNVAYVAAAGTGTACTKAAPCGTLAGAVAKGKAYVKVAGGGAIADTQVTIIDSKAVTILADEGATLDRSNDGGAVIRVQGTADVKIFDLEITGASGGGGNGIDVDANGSPKLALARVKVTGNQGLGISATGGSITVSQSTISGNLGGGISISGVGTAFSIADNFVFYNGRALGAQASNQGGVAIASNTAGSKFERNTVAFNESNGLTFRGGASCNAPLASAGGNLLFRNSEPDGAGGLKNDATTQANLTGGCPFGNSFSAATDAGNLGFKSPLIAPFDFHLTAASPATVRDAGGACSGTDVDGDARPQGAACDLGADEYNAN